MNKKLKNILHPLWIIAYIIVGGVIVIFYIICSIIAFIGITFDAAVNALDRSLDKLIGITRWFKNGK